MYMHSNLVTNKNMLTDTMTYIHKLRQSLAHKHAHIH